MTSKKKKEVSCDVFMIKNKKRHKKKHQSRVIRHQFLSLPFLDFVVASFETERG